MSYHRKQEDSHRLKKLYNKTKNSYGAGVWYSEKNIVILDILVMMKKQKLFAAE